MASLTYITVPARCGEGSPGRLCHHIVHRRYGKSMSTPYKLVEQLGASGIYLFAPGLCFVGGVPNPQSRAKYGRCYTSMMIKQKINLYLFCSAVAAFWGRRGILFNHSISMHLSNCTPLEPLSNI